MPFSLLPRTVVAALPNLTPRLLRGMGVTLLLLDFDNTVVPYTTDTPEPAIRAWFRTMKEQGVRLCVVSNSRKPRVVEFCRQWELPCYTRCRKPSPKWVRQAAQELDTPLTQCALVGDQIYTDVLAANLAGVRSILVRPIHLHNFWLKARHVLEQPFLLLARHRKN